MRSAQRLNPFEHALKRPDVYIGSVKTTLTQEWVFDKKTATIKTRRIKYNPGLVRIFVEILSNAIDNKWRSAKAGIPMKRIEIKLDKETGLISIWNDGADISTQKSVYAYTDPITQTITQDELYPAELYFGYMLAGTNYDDEEDRKTSGRNGMGAKAANVFSSFFQVDHASPTTAKKCVFTYRNNLTVRDAPIHTNYRRKTGYTQVSFIPDFKYFDYPALDDDLESVFEKLAYDTAMITGLHVVFNGKKIEINTLEKYVALYFPGASTLRLTAPSGDEAVLVEQGGIPDDDSVPNITHVAFVNGIYTREGGVHVKVWRDAFLGSFVRQFNARKGKFKVTAREVYPYVGLFVRCELTNPTFESQTKNRLASPTPNVVKLYKKGFERILKWNFVKQLYDKLEEKAQRLQNRKESGGKRYMSFGSKADDANWAGTRKSRLCTLFITEGQSAKSFATAGISTLPNGHDKYGAFAIKGKFINATNNSARLLHDNQEVQSLARIIGLERGRDYVSDDAFNKLRYGHVCFLTDADDDGIHIRGLLINFFSAEYPSLWKRTTSFFTSMSTPVNKVTQNGTKTPLYFYSTPDFIGWQDSYTGPKPSSILYIKGLGTMTAQQAKYEFAHPKMISYKAENTENEKKILKLGFDGRVSKLRKQWILDEISKRQRAESHQSAQFKGNMTLSSFINQHVIVYHCTAITRALPSYVDGLKESQRKILYGCFLKKLSKPAKVDQLAGFIAERTGYRHGGVSLQDTIVKMGQGFVGSNNIPLLQNAGQFGSRLQGGADAAASRYIYTAPERLTRVIFPQMDDTILSRVVEDGVDVEPLFYSPVIPIVLANGSRGIASGFSTFIPAYNPLDLVAWIRGYFRSPLKVERPPLVPWYRGYKGIINIHKDKTYWTSEGSLQIEKDGYWHVRELPIGLWTNKFKEHLEKLALKKNLITSISTYNTPNTVHFKFRASKDFIPSVHVSGNMNLLCQKHSLTNLTALDPDGVPHTFESPEHILYQFCRVRLELYGKRMKYLLRSRTSAIKIARNKCTFIRAVADRTIDMLQSDDALFRALDAQGIERINGSFQYLLDIPTGHLLSQDKAASFEAKVVSLQKDIDTLNTITPKELWSKDLVDFETEYKRFLKTSVRRDDC